MISPPERSRPRRAGESYEEKCERRQETREALRRRGHAHSARRPGRSEEQPQSPRQREFLRRRNLGSTTGQLSAPVLLQVMLHLHRVGALMCKAAAFVYGLRQPRAKCVTSLAACSFLFAKLNVNQMESCCCSSKCNPLSCLLN